MENGKILAAAVAMACAATAGCAGWGEECHKSASADPAVTAVRRPVMAPMYKGQSACKKDMHKATS